MSEAMKAALGVLFGVPSYFIWVWASFMSHEEWGLLGFFPSILVAALPLIVLSALSIYFILRE